MLEADGLQENSVHAVLTKSIAGHGDQASLHAAPLELSVKTPFLYQGLQIILAVALPASGTADCSYDLSVYNICADSGWSLYNNSGHPFCCLVGFEGGKGSWYDSCRDNGFPASETPLPQETPGLPEFGAESTPVATSARTSIGTSLSVSTLTVLGTISTTTFGPSPAETTATTTTNTVSKKLSPGAISGIVIGSLAGVALIGAAAWLIGRKAGRRQDGAAVGVLHVVQIGGIESGPTPGYGAPQLR
ncbi:hypothetical protein TWF481_010134 [Arthrobotrys musiformis]|uniref:Uncharacterized protein n=1 Tax=Arthrobotrys musiformis TaxID=47236 RepID=A0AAV9W1Z4_9PEZI